MNDREQILKRLRAQINISGRIIGVAAGSGMTARYTVMGGADLILALSAGKLRHMGRSSLGSFLCYFNSNQLVMEFGTRELLSLTRDTPVIFGLNASDPTIHLYEYIAEIKRCGFAGINNFPSMGMLDGNFLAALEEDGNSFDNEVEAVRIASFMGLLTVAFVFNAEQAVKMTQAGADIICAHFGLTAGGMLGARRTTTLQHAKVLADQIFDAAEAVSPGVIKMIYGGPASTPADMDFLYQNTACMGYIGGSAFERIPVEQSILETAVAFKSHGSFNATHIMSKILKGNSRNYDYAEYVKHYISEYYMKDIRLSDLALVANITGPYLSTVFKKAVGYSFSEYLVRFRINKAAEIIIQERIPLGEVARMVGYEDYAQFSKMFRKYRGISPREFMKANINTTVSNISSV